ncbi:MAG: MarR family winged helix-turn-helix transcriptional regulator [Xanthobacteraceae bacterium]
MSASKARIYHRLQLAAHRIHKSADRAVLEAAAITTAQAALLAVVAASDAATQRGVADQLGLNESAVTAMVGRLLKLGLLERERDDTDARAWRLCVSGEGRAALKRIEKPFRQINQAIEAVLEPEEIARLADYLARIGKAFGAE